MSEPGLGRAAHAVVSSGTADVLTHDMLVRSRGDRPTAGWRAALYSATGGRVNPGLSRPEQQRRGWLTRITAQLPGCHEITVASMKGGVGKTTMATLLGLVLAEHRGDRVIALDANPDAGTLADRVLGHSVNYTVRDLLNNLDTIESLTDIARYTNLAGRLQVLASEQDPAMSESFNRDEYEAVTRVLRLFYNIIITDSGTGLLHSAMHGALASTKTLVIVGAPTVDAASRASKTLDWLMAHGHRDLVADAVVVLSCDRFSRDIDRAAVGAHFESRCRAVVQIPMDPHLATGGHIELRHLRPATRDAALALGAAVADAFGVAAASPEPGYAATSAAGVRPYPGPPR
jgi:MinD-like ATPase involved in chromosome partitioning or flagellar assembly